MGIYIFKYADRYQYVGKSVNIRARILSHFENSKLLKKEAQLFLNSNSILVVPVQSEFQALLLEAHYIHKYQPKYNVIRKDGKSYLYIKLSVKDKYPKINLVRKENDKSSLYFGPLSSTKEAEELLRTIRKVIPYCSQKKLTKSPCFHSKIGLCSPCPNMINTIKNVEQKRSLTLRYQLNIRLIRNILSGKSNLVLNHLRRQMKEAQRSLAYEEAIRIRESIKLLLYLITTRSFSRQDYISYRRSGIEELKKLIQPYYTRPLKLKRIECYDASNLNQKQATASMVVMIKGRIDHSQYKRFRIKSFEGSSDFDMLKETLTRRLKHSWAKPDLVVVDGGLPQVLSIRTLLQSLGETIPLMGIAKNPDRLVVGDNVIVTIRPDRTNSGFNLVRLVRDEAHRFAKKYHLLLRKKNSL